MFNYNFALFNQLLMISKNKQAWLTDKTNAMLFYLYDTNVEKLIIPISYKSNNDINNNLGTFRPESISEVACTFQQELTTLKIRDNITKIL